MKRKGIKLILVFLALILMSASLLPENKKPKFILESHQSTFSAGDQIELAFKSNSDLHAQLLMIHSYGKTLLDGQIKNGELIFKIPQHFSIKKGTVDWFLILNGENIQKGRFNIESKNTGKKQLENYLGPSSTIVGNDHFVTCVSIPTDEFDNPLPENTPAIIKRQFLNSVEENHLMTKDFIIWKKLFAPTKSGVELVSSFCDNINSKEFEANINPGIALNFSLFYSRNHEFADGNQITTLNTSIIKDKYGNKVSDGTMVTFIITTKNQTLLKTFGTTLDGTAVAQFLHPDHEETYSIRAFITGAAQSNLIKIAYKPINPTIEYAFSKDNRTITVGPLHSFMNQLVPDGIKVTLKIKSHNKEVEILEEDSSKGSVTFYLSPDVYKEKKYSFEISTLGKVIKTVEKNYD